MEIRNETPFQVETLTSKDPKGHPSLTVMVKGTFDIHPGRPAGVSANQIPIAYGDEFFDEKNGGSVRFESDIVPFKPRADIVLVGKAYIPGGRPAEFTDVALRVGGISKIIRVFGDRTWNCPSRLLPEFPSKPKPFTVMDLVYERSFGGIDMVGGGRCEENLVGRGYLTKKKAKGIDGAPLPNLEDPKNLIKSWEDHPKPVGFGFYGKNWMPRVSYIGTYDEKWRMERCPDLPEDFKFDFYNGAHPDLQVKGYLKGNEEVELVNLTPEGRIQFRLPGIFLNVVVEKLNIMNPGNPSVLQEKVDVNLDILCLIPDKKCFYMVWRGSYPVNDLTALEVRKIEVMCHS